MTLSRKKWNNIIIFVSTSMIAILTLLDNQTTDLPSNASPLLDNKAPLSQLKLNELWLRKDSTWRCHESFLNCQIWVKSWNWYQEQDLLQSKAKNWYLIPPSLIEYLTSITKIITQSTSKAATEKIKRIN